MLGGCVSWQFKSFALEKDEHLGQMMLLLHKPESIADLFGVLQKRLIFYLNRDSCGSFG